MVFTFIKMLFWKNWHDHIIIIPCRHLAEGIPYSYTVTAIVKLAVDNSVHSSLTSPKLDYIHNGPYCGDGHMTYPEQCDDGNLKDGDGCSLNCKIEKFFHCTGKYL
jgi:pappalysin-1